MRRRLTRWMALLLVLGLGVVLLKGASAGCSKRQSWSYEIGHVSPEGRFQPDTRLVMLPVNDSEDVAAMSADPSSDGAYVARVLMGRDDTRVPAPSSMPVTIRMRAPDEQLISPGVTTAFDLYSSKGAQCEYRSRKGILFNEGRGLEGEFSTAIVIASDMNARLEIVRSTTSQPGTFCGFPRAEPSPAEMNVSQPESANGPSGERSVKVRVEIPKAGETHLPLWWTLVVVPSPDLPGGLQGPTLGIGGPREPDGPDLSLRSLTAGQQVAPITNARQKDGQIVVGSRLRAFVSLGGSHVWREKHLLNDDFGILPAGEYELSMKLSVTVPKKVTPHLSGQEAREGRVYTSGADQIVTWSFPQQKVRFRVSDSPKERDDEVFARVQCFERQNKVANIEVPDWLSLLLINDQPAWDVLIRHLDQTPQGTGQRMSRFLGRYFTAEEAITRVTPLLSSGRGRGQRVALDVISERGSARDALLLRDLLQPKPDHIHWDAFTCVARLLNKPLPPGFGTRPISEEDVKLVLGWLDALSAPATGSAPAAGVSLQTHEQ